MKKLVVYIFFIASLLVGYAIALQIWNASVLADVIPTALALITATTFWVEYTHNKSINEAKFIMELNNQFISNDFLKAVEWDLEKYYEFYRDHNNKTDKQYDVAFEKKYSLENHERQDLINYLVHLEGIATLVCSNKLHLSEISNLMAYRYFIAVNNPVVQKLELLPSCYSDHYRGIRSI